MTWMGCPICMQSGLCCRCYVQRYQAKAYTFTPAPALSDEDVERIADRVAKKRGEKRR